jgi:hypothetical protein
MFLSIFIKKISISSSNNPVAIAAKKTNGSHVMLHSTEKYIFFGYV